MALTQPLHEHHKHCDHLFAAAEEAAAAGRWAEARRHFDGLRGELEAHFATEEEVLFPAFEQKSGMVGGPSQVMRLEHRQMRELLRQMGDALGQEDDGRYGGVGETLLVLMQQHNMKEENILYPLCERTLSGDQLDLAAGLRKRLETSCPA